MKIYIRRILSLTIALLCAVSALNAQELDKGEALDLLKKTDSNTSFVGVDFSANYSLVQDKPGQGKTYKTAIIYRRDAISAYTILLTGPASDKGKGYVQYDNNIWFYDPADEQFVFTSAKDKFEGTNINNADFAPQHFSDEYEIKSAKKVTLGKLDCVVFELSATAKSAIYPALKIWVTQEDGLLRKKEDYSLSGQLLRTTAIPSYQLISGRSVPSKMLVVDNLRGKKIDGKMQYEQTQVTITNVSFAKQRDMVYTQKYVEMMSK